MGSGGRSPATVVASSSLHIVVCRRGRPASPHPPPLLPPPCPPHRAPHRAPRRHHHHRLRHHRSHHLLHHLRRPLRRRRRCRFPPLPPSEPAAAVTSPPPRRLALSLPPPSCQVGCDRVRLREELCICCRRSRRAEHACAREGRRRGRTAMHVTCAGAVCVVCSVHEDVRACRAAAAWMQLFCAPPSHGMSNSQSAACFCVVRCRACLAYPRADAAGQGVCVSMCESICVLKVRPWRSSDSSTDTYFI